MYLISSIFVYLFITLSVKCERIENVIYLKEIRNDSALFKLYNPNFDNYRLLIDHIILSDESDTFSNDCKDSLLELKNGLIHKETWALQCM